MKRYLWVLGGCFLAVLLLAVAGAGVLYYIFVVREFPGRMRASYKAANYDPRLTREASTATVVITRSQTTAGAISSGASLGGTPPWSMSVTARKGAGFSSPATDLLRNRSS